MTSDLEHPTYANPTVVEALCHLDFEPSSESAWQISRPTEFLQLVSDEYRNVEAVSSPSITISPPGPPTLRITAALKLSNDDKSRYIAIGDRHFAFGHMPRYPGWQSFRAPLLNAWDKFVSVARPREISRIGLRYVNVIPRTAEHPLISDWLKATATIPETLIRSKADPFLLRVESWTMEKSLLVVTVGITAAAGEQPKIVFDIDHLLNTKSGITTDELSRNVETLHDDVWREFASARTPRLDAYLRGVSQ
jgi:uncharacterized protein (TIGR04255 family)